MSDRTTDELLSAYLDGELSADQQARIERQLAEDAELRQLLDELRGLRGGLESLPQYRLEEDFAARVLRRAEQSMLAGSGANTEPHSLKISESISGSADDADRPAAASAPARSWMKHVRSWGWAAAAIAAGVLLMVFYPEPAPEHREVASAPSAATTQPRTIEPLATGLSAAPHSTTTGIDALAGERLNREEIFADRPHEAKSEANLFSLEVPDPPFAPDATIGGRPLPLELSRDVAKKPDPHEDSTIVRGKMAGNTSSGNNGAFPDNEMVSRRDGDTELLIVHCTVTPEAARIAAFDNVLADRQIAWDATQQAPPPKGIAQTQTQRSVPQDRGGSQDKRAAAVETPPATSQAPAAPESGVDVVLVESTPQQISSVLAELNGRPEWFSSVQVEPAPDAAGQQAFRNYSRAYAPPLAGQRGQEFAKQAPETTNLSDAKKGGDTQRPGESGTTASRRGAQEPERTRAQNENSQAVAGKAGIADVQSEKAAPAIAHSEKRTDNPSANYGNYSNQQSGNITGNAGFNGRAQRLAVPAEALSQQGNRGGNFASSVGNLTDLPALNMQQQSGNNYGALGNSASPTTAPPQTQARSDAPARNAGQGKEGADLSSLNSQTGNVNQNARPSLEMRAGNKDNSGAEYKENKSSTQEPTMRALFLLRTVEPPAAVQTPTAK